MIQWLVDLDWSMVAILCMTLGLAPFAPPHLFEKLGMLKDGTLKKPIDWFDLFMHGSPFLLALAKALAMVASR